MLNGCMLAYATFSPSVLRPAKENVFSGSQARQSNERLCTVTRFETEANTIGREASQSVRTQCWSVEISLKFTFVAS